jgi:hypothetical protein
VIVTVSVVGTASITGLATRLQVGTASVSGQATVTADGFRSFFFDATLYERKHVIYIAQDKQRIALVSAEKPRMVSVPQAAQRLAKVA